MYEKNGTNTKPNILEIAKLKQTLRELVTDEGMETALRELEKNLHTDVPKYDTQLQLLARLKEIDNQRIKKIVSDEQATLQYDRLRDDVLSFFTALEESDFSKETAKKANLIVRRKPALNGKERCQCTI